MPTHFDVIRHQDLGPDELGYLRRLFDREYLADFGVWDPELPYGYSPADIHVVARAGTKIIGHIGFQRRIVAVGTQDIVVAGTGGVLVDRDVRGTGLGRRLMRRAQQNMREDAKVPFGYLGCRPAVVPFYESAGWTRIHAKERHTARLTPGRVEESSSSPILICPAMSQVSEWPPGDIDLRGGAW